MVDLSIWSRGSLGFDGLTKRRMRAKAFLTGIKQEFAAKEMRVIPCFCNVQ